MQPTITSTAPPAPATPRYRGPIWTLLILAPVIAEVLSGSTRLSFIFVLAPEIMVWGVGALLCRELVRRWRGGGTSLLLLGLGLSIAEEFIIQQTSIAPLPFPGADASLGRYWGVNWLYFLFMLGYESVWVVLVPVQITELIFPECREQAWLHRGGLIASCIAFLVGCRIAWYGWTQQARPRLHAAPYHPPLLLIVLGLAAIVSLVGLAWLFRGHGHAGTAERRWPGNPLLVGVTALVMGGAWWELITLVFVPRPGLPFWIPMAAGAAWALLAYVIFRHWSSARRWNDTHRWALAFGATLACMPAGYISSAGWTRTDLIFKAILNILAVLGFLILAGKVWRRAGANQGDESEDSPQIP